MLDVSPSVCRAARGLLDWTQEELAAQAGVGVSTVRGFEKGRSEPRLAQLAAMRTALERAGVELLERNGGGEGVRMREG